MNEIMIPEFGSLLEEIENNPIEARELSAARLALAAQAALQLALFKSDMSQAELSVELGITESAVSQALHGDGNLRIHTFARYLRALGFEASLEIKSAVSLLQSDISSMRSSKEEITKWGEFVGLVAAPSALAKHPLPGMLGGILTSPLNLTFSTGESSLHSTVFESLVAA